MKIHWCAGDIYLKDYINIDVDGILKKQANKKDIKANETTLDKYFKYEFGSKPRPFIIDMKANILEKWPFKDRSVSETVMISCIEHFDPIHELPHILKEINRVMKKKGKLVIDWPDIKNTIDQYLEEDPEFAMRLIYCNHKNKYSIHHWGFTKKTFPMYLGDDWTYQFKEVVKHDYPMQGAICTKIK